MKEALSLPALSALTELEAGLSLVPARSHDQLRYYIRYGAAPGEFLSALLRYDFFAAGKARDALPSVAWARFFAHHKPVISYGCDDLVDAWIRSGGLMGREFVA